MGKTAKSKASSVLNILGMTIAFTAFYVIMTQVMFDLRYNSCIENADEKYMIAVSWEGDEWVGYVPTGLTSRAINEIPGAEIGFFNRDPSTTIAYSGADIDSREYKLNVHEFSKTAAALMNVKMITGSFPENNDGAIISEKAAETMGVNIGDNIFIQNKGTQKRDPYTVNGIYKVYAKNSDLADCNIILNAEKQIMNTADNNFNYSAVVRFAHSDDQYKFNELFAQYYREFIEDLVAQYNKANENTLDENFIQQQLRTSKLIPLTDTHFTPTKYSKKKETTYANVLTMIGIALLIIGIAFINFVNFFIALIPEKMRAVNIRKVFGASRGILIWQFVKEALIYVGIAIVLACLLLLVITRTTINSLVESGVDLSDNYHAMLCLVGVSIVLAVIAALFPALKVTKVNAAIGVKSGYSRSAAGRLLRKTLIATQLSCATAMMVISSVFFLQYKHMTNVELGINKDNLYATEIPYWQADIKSTIERIAGVKAVTASACLMTGNSNSNQHLSSEGLSVDLRLRYVLPNYLKVMEIPMIYGKEFKEDVPPEKGEIILEATATDIASIDKLEKLLEVYSDFSFTGLCQNTNLKPIDELPSNEISAYSNMGYDYKNYTILIFRIEEGVDNSDVIRQVAKALCEYYHLENTPNVWTVDNELEHRYKRFKTNSLIIGLFSLVAIVIALMGVFGIVLFETEHRRHETAVRKVLGANGNDIVKLFCKQYLGIVLAACAIATPIAIVVCQRYLEQFSSKIDLSWWIFAASYLIIVLLTLGIVALQTAKASRENPVNNLKSE